MTDSQKQKLKIFTMRDIAEIKGCEVQAVHQMIKRKGIKGKRLGPMRYFSQKEADELISCIAIKGQRYGGKKPVTAGA